MEEEEEKAEGDRVELHMSDCHTRRVAPAVAAAFTLIKFPQAVGPILSGPLLTFTTRHSFGLPSTWRPSSLRVPLVPSSRVTAGSSINHCTLRLTSRTWSYVGGSSRGRLFEIANTRAHTHIHIYTCYIFFPSRPPLIRELGISGVDPPSRQQPPMPSAGRQAGRSASGRARERASV